MIVECWEQSLFIIMSSHQRCKRSIVIVSGSMRERRAKVKSVLPEGCRKQIFNRPKDYSWSLFLGTRHVEGRVILELGACMVSKCGPGLSLEKEHSLPIVINAEDETKRGCSRSQILIILNEQ